MDPVSGSSSAQRYFNDEEEEALRKDESTNDIVKRDGKTTENISGGDRTWRAEKEHQMSWDANKGNVAKHGAHAAAEGIEMGTFGAIEGSALAGLGLTLGGPIAGLYLGLSELNEAHVKGEEQAQARVRDDAHVGLISALDLPQSYKIKRLDTDYKDTAKGPTTPSGKITGSLMASKKDLATLQLHADRGMNAARDLSRSGMSPEAFFQANPKAAEAYRKDAAFKEGFDAYLHTRATQPAATVKEMDRKLDERDGWYAQSNVQVRA